MVAGGTARGQNGDGCLVGGRDEPLDDAGCHQSLLRVQVRRRLVNQVNVRRLPQTQSQGDSLQLPTGQVLNLRDRRRVSVTGSRPALWRPPQDGLTSWSMMLSICMGFMTSVMNCG